MNVVDDGHNFAPCLPSPSHPPTVATRNALIHPTGRIMICDFGLSKHMHAGHDGSAYYVMHTNSQIPFPMYLSPFLRPVFVKGGGVILSLQRCVCIDTHPQVFAVLFWCSD
jgi:hypothetical protein